MKPITKSAKLANVLYDIRGPIMDAAKQMEEEGQKLITLNIGNLAVFVFDAPEEAHQDLIRNLPDTSRCFLVKQGHAFHLYSYEPISGLPPGAEWRDAATILPQDKLGVYKGRGTAGGFSD